MKVICVYPIEKDKSTDFLLSIYQMLEKIAGIHFIGYRLQDKKEIDNIIQDISIKEELIVVYLGHGSSRDLQQNYGSILTIDQFSILEEKRVFFLSCRSKELLVNCNISMKEHLGFGNMITSWQELMKERDLDINAYKGITEEHIILFNSILTSSVCNALSRTIERKESFSYLFLKLKIYLNIEITKLLEKRIKGYEILVEQLFDLKHNLSLGY